MLHGSTSLGKLGGLAVIAALVAVAAWTYTGQSDSSDQASSHAGGGLTNFSLSGTPPKSDDAHGAKQGSGSGGRHRKAARAKPTSTAPVPLVPAISGPVPPGLPANLSPVSAEEVRPPSPQRNPGQGAIPRRPAPNGGAPIVPRLPKPTPAPGPRAPSPRPGAPTGGTPIAPPNDPPATLPGPGTAPTNPATPPTDPAGDPPGLDDTPAGGLDPTDLGEPVDETPDAGSAPAAAPAPAPGGAG
jgi:translation initiation factor IF-2